MQVKATLQEMMTNEMIINLNVLSALIEDIVIGNVDSTPIFTMHKGIQGLGSIYIHQEPSKP